MIFNKYLLVIVALLVMVVGFASADTWTYTTPGSYVWQCPVNVTFISLGAVGAGSSGTHGTYVGSYPGGSAGERRVVSKIAVIPGNNYTVLVGTKGATDTGAGRNSGSLSSAFGYTTTGGSSVSSAGANGDNGFINTTKYAADGADGTSAGGDGGLGYGAGGGAGGGDSFGGPFNGGAGADGYVSINVYGTGSGNLPVFSGTPLSGIAGTLVSFTDLSVITNSTGLSYLWDFGDGTTSTTPGNVNHVFAYIGSYTVSLTLTNGGDNATETKESYVNLVNREGTTTFYTPKQTTFKVVDKNDNPIIGSTVTANFNQSTLPVTVTSWLISNYGMNIDAVNEAMNGTLLMNGITDSTGAITFTMQGTLGYDVNVTYNGSSYLFMINTHDTYYLLRCNDGTYTSPQDAYNSYANTANSTLTFSEPNSSFMTMGVDYYDSSGNTDNLIFSIKMVNNGTVMFTQSQAISGATRVLINRTYPNIRGQQWLWYYDAHRTV